MKEQSVEAPLIENHEFENKPFFPLTQTILNCVRDHDFNQLAGICDDDFGIIDINTQGGSEIIHDREGWENWFQGLFARLKTMQAKTWSEITNYEALQHETMGYSVVDFDQVFHTPDTKLRFKVTATIIWKKVNNEWKESRYHSSLVSVGPDQ